MSDLSIQHAPGVSEEVSKQFMGHCDGEPIAFDYDCALLERKTSRGYTYTAVNRSTGRKFRICSRKDYPHDSEVEDMLNAIRNSDIAGAGRLQADRPIDEKIGIAKAREILSAAMESALREYQYMDAAHKEIAGKALGAMTEHEMRVFIRDTSWLDIVGCLIAAIIAKRGRMNDDHARRAYPKMQYADMPRMPIVLSVPNISMQRRLIRELLPRLSDMLYECGVINEALTFIDRKGHDSYVCHKKARDYESIMRHRNRHKKMDKLLERGSVIDLDDHAWLSGKDRNAISADGNCDECCPYYEDCKYIEHLEAVKSYGYDIQVCTHKYFIADIKKRFDGSRPLIPNYQSVIICDAYECLQLVEDMFSIELVGAAMANTVNRVLAAHFGYRGMKVIAKDMARKLLREIGRFFRRVSDNSDVFDDADDLDEPIVDLVAVKHLRTVCKAARTLVNILYNEAFYAKTEELLLWVHNRYGADVSSVNIRNLLGARVVSTDNDIAITVNRICRAICKLSELENRIQTEKANQQRKGYDVSTARRSYQRYVHNTENEAIRNVDSDVQNTILERAKSLLRLDYPTGMQSAEIIRLAKDIEKIFYDCEAVSDRWSYDFKLIKSRDTSRLCAIPREPDLFLFSEIRLKHIPAVLLSGTLPEDVDAEDFRLTLRLGGKPY